MRKQLAYVGLISFVASAFGLEFSKAQPVENQAESKTTEYLSAAERARPLLKTEFAFRPSVFSRIEADDKDGRAKRSRGRNGGKKDLFPSADFVDPGQARKLLGNYEIETTFYDEKHRVVDEPTAPGRYGAVVKIKAEDGRVYTRFRTLYKMDTRVKLWGDQIQGGIVLPAGYGVDEQTWNNQRGLVNEYIAATVARDIQRSHDLAVLLAGMKEMGPQQNPASRLENAVSRDRQWWLTLKRKLNGNAVRFSQAIQVPVTVDGLNAPTLKDGTEEEAGMKPGTVDKIHAVLNEWANNSDQPFNVCVARRGIVFFDRAYGARGGEPITTDTKHVVFSITKALSGTLLMTFIDQGVIRLDDPVGKILPEFDDDEVDTPVTFHHLFTHTADMDGHFTDTWNDLEHVYGEAYPFLKIGKQHRYNGTSIAIGLKALEQVTGLTLPQLYQKYLFGPLGCESIESIDGSALTWSNAYDLARVGQMLSNRGAYGTLRFFSEDTFEQMLPRKLEELLGPETEVTWGIGLTWFGGHGLSHRTIGHGSASSCTLRVDLEKDLVITMTRKTAGKNFGVYHPKFINAVTNGAVD